MKPTFVEYSGCGGQMMIEALYAQEFPGVKFPPEIQSVTVCEIKEIDEINTEKVLYGGARFFGMSYCAGDDEYSELEGRQRSLERAVASMIKLGVAVPEAILEQLAGYTKGLAQIKENVEIAQALAIAKQRTADVNQAVEVLTRLGQRVPNALAAEHGSA